MKGIPFISTLAAAVNDGTKTETRRLVKDSWQLLPLEQPAYQRDAITKCPYGKVGDTLYIREDYYQFGHWEKTGTKTKGGRDKWAFVGDDNQIQFDRPLQPLTGMQPFTKISANHGWYKRLARFMPEKHARTFVEITQIRVQRLQDITPKDAIAEGFMPSRGNGLSTPDNFREAARIVGGPYPRGLFAMTWNEINGDGSWDANPYVWAITFLKIDRPAKGP